MSDNEDMLKKFQEMQEALRRPGEQDTKIQHPCPNCGHCPACGRGGWYPAPYRPYVPWGPYWYGGSWPSNTGTWGVNVTTSNSPDTIWA